MQTNIGTNDFVAKLNDKIGSDNELFGDKNVEQKV